MWPSFNLLLLCLTITYARSEPSSDLPNYLEKRDQNILSDIQYNLNNISASLSEFNNDFKNSVDERNGRRIIYKCIEAIRGRDMEKANEIVKQIDTKSINYVVNYVFNNHFVNNFDKLYNFCITIDDPTKSQVAFDALIYEISQSDIDLNAHLNRIKKVFHNYSKRTEQVWNFIAEIATLIDDTTGATEFINSFSNDAKKISVYKNILEKDQKNYLIVAHNLRNLMQNESFSKLDGKSKSEAFELKANLPACVRNAIFSSEVYIKSAKYDNYLTASKSRDPFDKRMVFATTGDSAKVTEKTWSVEITEDFNFVKFQNKEYEGEFLSVSWNLYNQNFRVNTQQVPSQFSTGETNFVLTPVGDKCFFKSQSLGTNVVYTSDEKFNPQSHWVQARDLTEKAATADESTHFFIESAV